MCLSMSPTYKPTYCTNKHPCSIGAKRSDTAYKSKVDAHAKEELRNYGAGVVAIWTSTNKKQAFHVVRKQPIRETV